MKVKITCPLGSECERIVDDHIERCAWYVELEGANPQDGSKICESRCAMQYIPLIQIEANQQLHGLTASIQSMRNETVKNQMAALGVLNNAKISSDS